ncbi:hypothetical protein CSH63_17735 [Micromonospora tulbaghiae]|uniref:Uncharacterized protein n=1 Tax=Micromonospora tulbaghiae TaxID=479978 RepID=A0A386WMK4_9ACTN|nr:hypothetical protein [Micromonospora tulbaghiae]AYF29273.1 hypothetical protein CSH63_17735 [Micromonospora tulbaghiae]
MSARTQAQILARFTAIYDGGTDWMGFRLQVLLESMTRDSLRAVAHHLNAPEPDDDTTTYPAVAPDQLEQTAREYLTFAIGKAVDHRGISASRSVDKLREYAWLLGRDDVVQAMENAEYEQYGVPKLRAFAAGLGWPWPAEGDGWRERALARMAEGLPCDPDCADGCA